MIISAFVFRKLIHCHLLHNVKCFTKQNITFVVHSSLERNFTNIQLPGYFLEIYLESFSNFFVYLFLHIYYSLIHIVKTKDVVLQPNWRVMAGCTFFSKNSSRSIWIFLCWLGWSLWSFKKCSIAASAAGEFCKWVKIGIDVYVPRLKYKVEPHSSTWFSSSSAAIAHFMA